MSEHAFSGSPYETRYGFSRAVRVGNVVEVAGTAPIPPQGGTVEETAYGQMVRCCQIAADALLSWERTRTMWFAPECISWIQQMPMRWVELMPNGLVAAPQRPP